MLFRHSSIFDRGIIIYYFFVPFTLKCIFANERLRETRTWSLDSHNLLGINLHCLGLATFCHSLNQVTYIHFRGTFLKHGPDLFLSLFLGSEEMVSMVS